MKTAEQIFHCVNDGIEIENKWFSKKEMRDFFGRHCYCDLEDIDKGIKSRCVSCILCEELFKDDKHEEEQ
jgi:hypothetical protein